MWPAETSSPQRKKKYRPLAQLCRLKSVMLKKRRPASPLNAPMAAVLGQVFLGETLLPLGWAGVGLCSMGVGVAVMGRPGRSGTHAFERVQGALWIAVGAGLLAALPVLTIMLCEMAGLRIVGFLTSGPPGWLCLGSGLILYIVGLLWMRALMRASGDGAGRLLGRGA